MMVILCPQPWCLAPESAGGEGQLMQRIHALKECRVWKTCQKSPRGSELADVSLATKSVVRDKAVCLVT